MRKSLVSKSCICCAIICGLCLVLPTLYAKPVKNKKAPSRVDFRVTGELVSLVKQNTPVALVRFQTDTGIAYYIDPKRKGETTVTSRTGIVFDAAMNEDIVVQGNFSLIKKLHMDGPTLGKVKKSIRIGRGFREGSHPSPTFHRLKALIPDKPEAILLLAVWPAGSKHALDATFVGPFQPKDAEYLIEVSEVLAKDPYPKIDQRHAEKLLASTNPWKIYLGLLRLEELKTLSAEHFRRAAESSPAHNIDATIWDMLLEGMYNTKVKEGLTKQLGTFFSKAGPDKQKIILTTVNHYLGRRGFRKLVDTLELQNAAQQYRQQIVNDAARREVLHEIDALLRILKNKSS